MPVNSAGKAATNSTSVIRTAATMNRGLVRNCDQASVQNPPCDSSAITDSRVKGGVEQIDHEVGQQVNQHQHRDDCDHRRGLLAGDRLVERAPDAMDVED